LDFGLRLIAPAQSKIQNRKSKIGADVEKKGTGQVPSTLRLRGALRGESDAPMS
jgi:hypothetical protein